MNALSTLTPTSSLREVRQVVFEVVVCGLAAQAWLQSLDSNGNCCWDSADGKRRCAVGHVLIPSGEIPSVDSSRQTILRALDLLVPELKAWVREPAHRASGLVDMLLCFQTMHDKTPSQAEMHMKFKKYGEEYALKWPEGVER